jgi:GPH family glycoside/pentoside/hexuronide:cation symporter
MGIDQYLLVYFMNNGDMAAGLIQKGLLTSGYGIVGFASIPVITWLAGKFGKKGSLYFVYGLMVFGGIMKWYIFTPGHPIFYIGNVAIDPIILIDPLLCGPMWVAVKIMLASMMADICDEDELKHGQRREGMFSAVFSWIEKMVVSLAYLGTGFALALAHFNPDLGGNQAPETFTRMRLFLAGAPALTAVFAIVALIFYPITAQRAAQTRRQLEERRGAV